MTLELVPWRGANVPVLARDEISRYNIQDYLNWIQYSQNYMGTPAPVTTYGNRPAEPISSSFEGFVWGMLYAAGPVAAVEAYRLRVFGQAPLLYQDFVDGRGGDFFDDPVLERLREPWTSGNLSDLMKRTLVYGDFGGNAFVLDLEDELVLVRPDWVEIVLEKRMHRGGQVGWRQRGIVYYEGGLNVGDGVPFLPGEYCHFVPGLPDPLATYRGMSWLTPLVREVQADKAASDHKVAFFENAASPNLAVSLPKELTTKQFNDFVEAMDAKHKGVQNVGKTLYTGGGADVTVIGANMQQMDFSSVQGKGETRVANAGGVPPTLLSFSEGMQGSSLNAGNYTAAKRNFVDTTMRDLWQNFASSIQKMDAFRPPKEKSRLWYVGRDIPFMHEDAKDLAEIQQTQASTVNSYITAGFKPDTAVTAVERDDLKLLEHTGLTSVQLMPPGSQDTDGDGVADAEAQAGEDYEAALDEFRSELELHWDEIWRADLGEEDDDDFVERADYYNIRVDKGLKGGGRFRKLSDIVGEALNNWLNGDGDADDPLEPFSREQLRKASKDLGVEPRRGASAEEIKLGLLKDARARFRGDSNVDAKPSHRLTLSSPTYRDQDVGVYHEKGPKPTAAQIREVEVENRIRQAYREALTEVMPNGRTRTAGSHVMLADLRERSGVDRKDFDAAMTRLARADAVSLAPQEDQKRLTPRLRDASVRFGDENMHMVAISDPSPRPLPSSERVSLYRESSSGQRGSKVVTVASLAELEQWGRDNDEPQVAEWAASERGAAKPTKRAPAKRAPAKKAATPAVVSPEQAREVEVENRIRQAYRDAIAAMPAAPNGRARRAGDRIALVDLRERVGGDISREELDAGLRRMSTNGGRLQEEENQQNLTPADREAAARIGARTYHFLLLDDPSDRPAAPPAKAAPRKAVKSVPAKATRPKREPLGDPAAKLSSLRALGDREAARDELDLLLLDDLKTLAKAAGVATSGRKRDVVDRIAAMIDADKASAVPDGLDNGSDMGLELLAEENDLPMTGTRDELLARLRKAGVTAPPEWADDYEAPKVEPRGLDAKDLAILQTAAKPGDLRRRPEQTGAGRQHNGRIDDLRRLGYIKKEVGGDHYSLTDAGRAALVPDPEQSARDRQASLDTARTAAGRADLLRDGDPTSLAESLEADRTPQPSNGDELMSAIAQRQGFDERPTVVPFDDWDALVGQPGYRPLFRGVANHGTEAGAEAGFAEELRNGEAFFPTGVWGSGIYTSVQLHVARRYGPDPVRMALRPDARVAEWSDLKPEHQAFLASLAPDDPAREVFADPGRYAAARGFDAMRITGSLEDEMLVFNRSALLVREARGAGGVGPKADRPGGSGRDLSAETDFDALPPEYNRENNTDPALGEILHRQGFDAAPSVVSRADFDAAVRRGAVRETWRGYATSTYSDLTPEQMAEQYRTGDAYAGVGINGNGTYVAVRRADGEYYGRTLLRIGLRSDARVISADDLDAEMDAYFATAPDQTRQHRSFEQQLLADLAKAKSPRARANLRRQYRSDVAGMDRRSRALSVQRDPGRFAALRGYDAIEIPKERSPDKHAELIILNRGATIVEEAE